ncbi:cadherin-87A-like [Haliotis cracherodii]|uniref:cadherin-87A-like n=1 Tax=Haliotis cracherodii TaxID=6455 RepID=UPI0039E8690B
MMGSAWMLLSALFAGLIGSSYQQANDAPYFLTLQGGSGIDGNLLDRLTKQGILENTQIGTSVGVLSCRDDDPADVIAGYGVQSQTLEVDQSTGEVTVNRQLDRENYLREFQNTTADNARLLKPVFTCWDNRGLTASVEVDITLTDVNDESPEFLNGPYSTGVNENAGVGTTIFSGVSVRDEDSADNARVRVACSGTDFESRTACDAFTVQTLQTGAGRYRSSIVLQRQLDFESRRSYTMTLKAVDLGTPALTTSVNVLINVADTQDTLPEFVNVPLTIYVKENVPQNTSVQLQIGARDGDQGNPRPVRIKIKNDTRGLFRLGPSKPDPVDQSIYRAPVIVNAPIDRETLLGSYRFEVEAVELDNGTETNARRDSFVQVDILDENDNIPSFSNTTYNVSLAEIDSNAQSNFQIPDLNIQVIDRDDPSNAMYTVVIVDQSQNTFKIFPEDEVSGNVAVNLLVINATLLDYDKPSLRTQTVVLEARESNINPRTSTATVSIFLQDLNDNSPQFTEQQYEFTLPENAPVETSIATIEAVDIDEGKNGGVLYSLRGTGNDQFTINATSGYLKLSKPLDYETQKVYQILVNAQDEGSPPRETSRTLTIRITNINDELPIPERALYQTYAQETSLELRPAVVVQARDNEDPSSNITYRIIAGNTRNNAFQVNETSGELTLVSYIDYDETPSNGRFEVVIQASDNGSPPQYNNMTVRVDVQDENNNSPTFMSGSYFANITEMAPTGTSVVSVIATDADSRKNGEFRYTIQSGGREHFDIGNSSGLITVSSKAKFDYNVFPVYRMTVFAIDSGSPPKTGTTIVTVNLQDANNKAPKFQQQIYVTSISEASPIGSSVLDTTATDEDSTSELRFSIPTSTIQARNSGGKMILSQVSFNFRNAFVVDPISGRITTNTTLRRDLAAEVSFSVLVRDLNAEGTLQQTATTSVLVTILGTNISTIYFTPARYYFSVTEGKQVNYVITTVAARDPACGNCLLRNYVEVDNSDPNGYLKVDRLTGQVSLTRVLDYDDGDRRLNIDIQAISNDSRTARTSVTVEVRDDNDHSPQFRLPSYDFTVSESSRYPFRVGYVKATDKDSGSFGRVVYSLSGQGAQDFEIYDTGMILVSRTANLDYETTRTYNLLITASDNPTNQSSTVRKQTSVTLTITVLDVNDQVPQFSAIYPFYVVENYNIGQSVGRIIATDGDAGTNGDIVYSMTDPSNLFRITNTGYILTQRSLRDQSPYSPFNVTVRAEDRGIPSLYNETQVIINIRSGQLDDGRPQWSIPRLGDPYYIDEGTSEEQLVLVAQAVARSVGPEVIFSLNSASPQYEKFKINSTTGRLTTNGVFDREETAIIQLILVATDRANTTLQSFRALTIYVRDKNDNVPEFGACPGLSLEVPLRVTISEDTPVMTSVYKVRACDLDAIINGVTYELETNIPLCQRQNTGSFTVDSQGVIYTDKSLDREANATHLVCVRAKVAQRRKRQAAVYPVDQMTDTSHVAYLIVTLSDVNDNSPKFLKKVLHEVVPSVPTERTVVRVEAIDSDSDRFNRVRYSITGIVFTEPGYPSYPLLGSFIVSPDTGTVSTNYPSYSEYSLPGSYFEVTLQAEDVDKPVLKDTMILYVYVFEPAQTMRVVIDETPNQARNKMDSLLTELNGVSSDSYFKVQQISYHRGVTDKDSTKTDLCFVVVSKDKVQSVRDGSATLDSTSYVKVLQKYGARSPGSCYKARSSLDKISWAPLWWTLVALAIFIFICCCILIGAICILYKNHKDFMDSQQTRMDPM